MSGGGLHNLEKQILHYVQNDKKRQFVILEEPTATKDLVFLRSDEQLFIVAQKLLPFTPTASGSQKGFKTVFITDVVDALIQSVPTLPTLTIKQLFLSMRVRSQ